MLPGWFTPAASFCAGAAATAAGVLIRSSGTPSGKIPSSDDDGEEKDATTALRTSTARGSPSGTKLMHVPTLPVRLFRPNDNLVIAFDTRNKNPLFCMERLTGRSSPRDNDDDGTDEEATGTAVSRKNKRFYEESTLLPHHRSRNHHYRNSGYDRGHLAPAADFSSDDGEMNDTFVLSNASPQAPRFNRSIWLRLEEFVRSVAKEEEGRESSTETWVITGPLWLPDSVESADCGGADVFRYSYVGIGKSPSLVSVPTHFFKVLVVVGDDAAPDERSRPAKSPEDSGEAVLKKFAAFVLPNSNSSTGERVRLIDFAVRLTDLETVSGLEFFPALFGVRDGMDASGANGSDCVPLRKEVADALTDDVRFRDKNNDRNGGKSINTSLVPSSNNKELSKGRRRKIKQLIRDNTPVPFSFQHLCRENEACFKLLRS